MKTRLLVLALSASLASGSAAASKCSAPADWLEAIGQAIDTAETPEELEPFLAYGEALAEFTQQDSVVIDDEQSAEWVVEEPATEPLQGVLRQARIEHAERLAAHGDADSLLGASLLTARVDAYNEQPSTIAQDYLKQAQRQAPNQVLTWIVAQTVCGSTETAVCDPTAALNRLTELEPDNAAFWLQKYANDPENSAAALQHAFAASRYDDHHTAVTRLALESHRGMRIDAERIPALRAAYREIMTGTGKEDAADDLDDAMLMRAAPAMEALFSSAFPFAFQAHAVLRDTCKTGTASDEIRTGCIRLYQRMAEGSSHMLGRNIAYAGLEALMNDDDILTAEVIRGRDRMRWLQATFIDHELDAEAANTLAFIERSMTTGEIAAMTERLKQLGLPMEPPADWDYEAWQQSLYQRFDDATETD